MSSIIPSTYGFMSTTDLFSFIFTVDTTKAGVSSSTQYKLPFVPGGSELISWGDGSTTNEQTHTYSTGGTYKISISNFTTFAVSNVGDPLKITLLNQFGDITWTALDFYGCQNVQGAYIDLPDFSGLTSLQNFLRDCDAFNYSVLGFVTTTITNFQNALSSMSIFNQFVDWNLSNGTNFNSFLFGTPRFNQVVAAFNLSSMTNGQQFLYTSTDFNQDVSALDVSAMTDGTLFLGLTSLSTANYDLLLVAWNALSLQSGVPFSVGTTKYTPTNVDTGTTDGTTTNKLVDSSQNFSSTVSVGDVVFNSTDTTYAIVTNVDSNTVLTISVDIMTSGEDYNIESSAAAKAHANMIITRTWTITDGGPV